MKTSLVILASVLLVLGMVGIAYGLYTDTVIASVSVPGALSINIPSGVLDFGDKAVGGPYNATQNPLVISVTSNVNYDLTTEANSVDETNFDSDGSGILAINNLKWSFDQSTWAGYTGAFANLKVGEVGSHDYDLYNQLSIPVGTLSDSYSLSLIYKVVQN
ncbi:MAG: hypothetical protein NT076_05565 [Candidatus Pacearchaeota archaeon]|nr:hypothetical protein [Candidatus Pacearchaeota archaeon]